MLPSVWKTAASAFMGLVGMVLLGYGKKNADVRSMVAGGALILLSCLL